MSQFNCSAYLVNTGWDGSGKRISIKATRAIIDAILDGSIEQSASKTLPVFNLSIPTALPGVDASILNPLNSYADPAKWHLKADKLADLFIHNFDQYTDTDRGKTLVKAGPSK